MSAIKYRSSANDSWQDLLVVVGPQGPAGQGGGASYLAGTGINIDSNNEISVDATELSYTDLQDKPTIPTVPTNVSSFTNDAGYLTAHQDISGKANSADLATVATTGDYDDLINKPTIPTVPTNISAFTNNVGYLTSHQDISGKANITDLANVAISGDYDDLINKPTIPTIPTNVSTFTNDAGYLTAHQSLAGYATQTYVDYAIQQAGVGGGTTYTAGTGIDITNGVISLSLANASQEEM